MQKVTDKGFWIDTALKYHLDTVDYNMDRDWDFVWTVSGHGETRIGKTVLAQQIGYYIAWKRNTPFTAENMIFSGEELRKKAAQFPKNSVFVYDESRAELDSKKVMSEISRNLLDFLSECGKYNHFIILVLPDFFELNKSMAVTRSSLLIDCYKKGSQQKNKNGDEVIKFERGFFNAYGRKEKKMLYIRGKKECNYMASKPTFTGEFRNHWTIDELVYDKKKSAFLQRTKPVAKEGRRAERHKKIAGGALKILSEFINQHEISKRLKDLGISLEQSGISTRISSI